MKSDLLQAAQSAVELVETNLAKLDDLTKDHAKLTATLQHIASQRAELIAGDADDKKKLTGIKDMDAQKEIRAMDLAKLESQIGCSQQEIITAAIDANGKVQELKEAMMAAEKAKAKAVLLEVFPAKVVGLMEAYLGHATEVKKLDIEYLPFAPAKVDFCLVQARKLRGQLDTLRSNVPVAQPAVKSVAKARPAMQIPV